MDMIVSMRLETAIQGPLLSAEQWRLWGDCGESVAPPPIYLSEAAIICQKECSDCL